MATAEATVAPQKWYVIHSEGTIDTYGSLEELKEGLLSLVGDFENPEFVVPSPGSWVPRDEDIVVICGGEVRLPVVKREVHF